MSYTNRSKFQGRRSYSNKRGYTNPGLRINPSRFINRVDETKPEEIYKSKHQFVDFNVDEKLKQNIISKNYIHPTAIQDQTIPHILEGRDVIGVANTGTGKTAAFLVPLIDKIIKDRRQNILIMAPTRELALQIQEELVVFARNLNIHSAICIGGTNIRKQINNLRRRPNFVIGTPGRLKDLIERRALNLNYFNTAVLDEADRMLDMGFINEIKDILALLPKQRHTLLFTATLSPTIEALTRQFQDNPIKVSVATRDTSANVDQDIIKFNNEFQKIDLLHDLLNNSEFNKVLIFGETKHGVESLSKSLFERGFKAISIHGNKNQSARQKALHQFKNDHVNILVATDVAARGLDIPYVSHVINYDVPASFSDYIHRIGRTGRAGEKGKALTFVK